MSGVVELLLLDRPRDCRRIGFRSKTWKVGISSHTADPLLGESSRIGIAPKDLLRPLLEPGIEACRLPVAGAMGLQVNGGSRCSHGPGADTSNDAVRHGQRARSSLDQWVMCNPLATGSRQASSTICALCAV